MRAPSTGRPGYQPGIIKPKQPAARICTADHKLSLEQSTSNGIGSAIARQLASGGEMLVVVPSNPVTLDARGKVIRALPADRTSGEAVVGWLPAGARIAMAFGTMSADLFESAHNREPERAVLFYVTNDDRADVDVARLIRTAGFEPVKVGGIKQSSRLEVGGDLHDLVVGRAQAQSLIGGP